MKVVTGVDFEGGNSNSGMLVEPWMPILEPHGWSGEEISKELDRYYIGT